GGGGVGVGVGAAENPAAPESMTVEAPGAAAGAEGVSAMHTRGPSAGTNEPARAVPARECSAAVATRPTSAVPSTHPCGVGAERGNHAGERETERTAVPMLRNQAQPGWRHA